MPLIYVYFLFKGLKTSRLTRDRQGPQDIPHVVINLSIHHNRYFIVKKMMDCRLIIHLAVSKFTAHFDTRSFPDVTMSGAGLAFLTTPTGTSLT